jgi:PKHD-type hydroxylase
MIWFLNKSVDNSACQIDLFSKNECEDIVKIGLSSNILDGTVENKSNNHVRKSKISWIKQKDNEWIYQKVSEAIMQINSEYFNYDLTYMQPLQFTTYELDNNFYGKHIDTSYMTQGSHRKLSFSILLSDPLSYDGGDLKMHLGDEPLVLPKSQGIMLGFPSYILHEVTQVTKGTRYSLVGWCCGPNFR